MKKLYLILCVVILSLTVSSCIITGVFLAGVVRTTFFGKKSYPAKEKSDTIDIYITQLPTRDYEEFAILEFDNKSDKKCIEKLTEKAREIGADAIIIASWGDYVYRSETFQSDSLPPTSQGKRYGMKAIAIKYLPVEEPEEEPEEHP